jgi:site-specific recombinase XerD
MFRHVFASTLTRDGVDFVTQKELLAHADIKTALRWAHSNDVTKRRSVNRLRRKAGDSGKTATVGHRGEKTV